MANNYQESDERASGKCLREEDLSSPARGKSVICRPLFTLKNVTLYSNHQQKYIFLFTTRKRGRECLKFHFRETGKPSTSDFSDVVRVGVLGRGATGRLGRGGLALLHPGVRGMELAQLGTVRLGPLLILVFNLQRKERSVRSVCSAQ